MAKQLKSLNTKHRIMMNRLLAGDKATDIAKDLFMSDSTFSVIKNSPLFKAEMDRMTRVQRHNIVKTSQQVSEIINAAAPMAARKIANLTDSEAEHIALRASEKLVELSDFGKERDLDANKTITITQQQMVLINEGIDE